MRRPPFPPFALLLLSSGLGLVAGAAGAAPIKVNDPGDANVANDGKCTLREAIQEAFDDHVTKMNQSNKDCDPGNGNDEITYPGGGPIQLKDQIYLSSDLSLKGMTIGGNGLQRLFVIGGSFSVKLDSLTLAGGSETKNAGNGGALLITTSTAVVEIVKSRFSANDAFMGGAIFNSGSTVTISDSTFQGNGAGTLGGALAGSGAWTISQSAFENNLARQGGGAISCYGGLLKVDGTYFSKNLAVGDPPDGGSLIGGGALQSACQTDVSFSLFEQNAALFDAAAGGALYFLPGSTATVNHSVLRANFVAYPLGRARGGGGIATFGKLTVDRSAIEGNSVYGPWGGGGIVIWNAEALVVNSMLRGNIASTDFLPPPISNLPAPLHPGEGAAIAVWGKSVPHLEITASTLAADPGASELFLDPDSPGVVILRNTLIDGDKAGATCAGNLANIFDGLVAGKGNNLQAENGASLTCPIPAGDPAGTTKQWIFPQPAGTSGSPQLLAFDYLLPGAAGAAAAAGNPATCQALPVLGKDLLDQQRPDLCTIGAVEAM